MRLALQFSLMILASLALGAGSKVVEGKLEATPEGGEWVLRIGTEAVPVAPAKKTRYWLHRAEVDAKAFHVGDAVVARIAPDEAPAALREISDKESWIWLEGIRKGVREGTVKGFDGKHLTLAFPDGGEMAYRATEKSKIVLDGKPATLGDLKAGQKLWAKGRTLPSLDVFLAEASDRAILTGVKIAKGGKGAGTKAVRTRKLAATGRLEGEIDLNQLGMRLFDLLTPDGVLLHVSYFPATVFTLGGTKCGPAELLHGRRATVFYKRDQYGRIDAAKVEIR